MGEKTLISSPVTSLFEFNVFKRSCDPHEGLDLVRIPLHPWTKGLETN
jgi:hypothetical protein